MSTPFLSIIVVVYNMQREAPRTLYTLSAKYQINVGENDYEVLVVDNGSSIPLSNSFVRSFGSNFQLIRFEPCTSPAAAINKAVRMSKGDLVMICIDGARMLSPGILHYTIKAFKAFDNPLVATMAFHLGPKIQNESIAEGYCQQVEDQILDSIPWRTNGYQLFTKSVLAGSSRGGWLLPLGESNCVTINKSTFERINGYDESFVCAGGGYVNLDFYKRAVDQTQELIILSGEGTFHQVHGGAATNAPPESNAAVVFHNEYVKLKGSNFTPTQKKHTLLGPIPREAMEIWLESLKKIMEESVNYIA